MMPTPEIVERAMLLVEGMRRHGHSPGDALAILSAAMQYVLAQTADDKDDALDTLERLHHGARLAVETTFDYQQRQGHEAGHG